MIALDTVHRLDAIEGLKQLGDESVDLVVTDPPYGIASKNRRTISCGRLVTTSDLFGAWDEFHPFDYDLLIDQVLSQCFRRRVRR